jgi:uncharacterized protein YlaN (UPF0358 family)
MKNLNKNNKANQLIKQLVSQLVKAIAMISLSLTLSSCASYKTSWDCPKVKGIGCSSLEYADEIARKQILLNTDKKQKKEILIRKNENNFEIDEIY